MILDWDGLPVGPDFGLPTSSVRLWREERTVWWTLPVLFLGVGGPVEVEHLVAVSRGGLTVVPARDGTFTPWSNVAGVQAAPAPDLAIVERVGGRPIELGSRHLPRWSRNREAIRRERQRLLRRAWELGREGDVAAGQRRPPG